MPKVIGVVARDESKGIGVNGSLPWRNKKDMQWFKTITSFHPEGKENAVVMGRKTWESLPGALKGRKNIILSSSNSEEENFFKSYEECLEILSKDESIGYIFIIGGATLYNKALETGSLDEFLVTEIPGIHECDTFLDFCTVGFNSRQSVNLGDMEVTRYIKNPVFEQKDLCALAGALNSWS